MRLWGTRNQRHLLLLTLDNRDREVERDIQVLKKIKLNFGVSWTNTKLGINTRFWIWVSGQRGTKGNSDIIKAKHWVQG